MERKDSFVSLTDGKNLLQTISNVLHTQLLSPKTSHSLRQVCPRHVCSVKTVSITCTTGPNLKGKNCYGSLKQAAVQRTAATDSLVTRVKDRIRPVSTTKVSLKSSQHRSQISAHRCGEGGANCPHLCGCTCTGFLHQQSRYGKTCLHPAGHTELQCLWTTMLAEAPKPG